MGKPYNVTRKIKTRISACIARGKPVSGPLWHVSSSLYTATMGARSRARKTRIIAGMARGRRSSDSWGPATVADSFVVAAVGHEVVYRATGVVRACSNNGTRTDSSRLYRCTLPWIRLD